MNSNLFKNDIPILYHNPGTSSRESEMHYHVFSQRCDEVIRIEDTITAYEGLKDCPNKFFVITSEMNGEQFLKKIENLPSVLAIIIFCKDAKYHKKWITQFQNVHAIIDSGPQEVIDEVMKIHFNIITGKMLKLAQNGLVIGNLLEMTNAQASTEKEDYFHFRQDVEMEFRTVLLIYLKSLHASAPLADKVLEELKNLKPEESTEIDIIYNKRKNNLLEAIIYLYSTDILYEQLNKFIASKQYDKFKNIIAAILVEIKKRPDLQLDSSMKKKCLYRGVTCHEIKSQYEKNEKGFWPAFTSTSLSEKTAKGFAGPNGIIFRITLAHENTHPHILLGTKMAEFKEKEVLLLPYFAIKVKNISSKNDLTYIDVEQDESQQVLSLNDKKFKEYWQNTIQQEIKPPIEKIFKTVEEEAKQKLKKVNYFQNELIPHAFNFLRAFFTIPSDPEIVVEALLNTLLNNMGVSSALENADNSLHSAYLQVIDQFLPHINKQIKDILEESSGSFKAQFQNHLGSMLISNYDLDSLPMLSNLDSILNSDIILEALDIEVFYGNLEDRNDEEWIELIKRQINSPKFTNMIESLVIKHMKQNLNNLENRLFEIIKKTMGL